MAFSRLGFGLGAVAVADAVVAECFDEEAAAFDAGSCVSADDFSVVRALLLLIITIDDDVVISSERSSLR